MNQTSNSPLFQDNKVNQCLFEMQFDMFITYFYRFIHLNYKFHFMFHDNFPVIVFKMIAGEFNMILVFYV